MTENNTTNIPGQTAVPWSVAFTVSWGNLRRRFLRSLITMAGVVLGIAFVTYMWVNDNIVGSLIAMKIDLLNILLQKTGIDIYADRGADPMMTLLIALSLFTCLVGITNSMLMSVTERIREIGTLKCLGAEDSFIVKSYLIESSLQGIIGTLLGVVLGFSVSLTVNLFEYGTYVFASFAPVPNLKSALMALVIGSVMSVAASILPAYWAARKQPVDAMRVEE